MNHSAKEGERILSLILTYKKNEIIDNTYLIKNDNKRLIQEVTVQKARIIVCPCMIWILLKVDRRHALGRDTFINQVYTIKSYTKCRGFRNHTLCIASPLGRRTPASTVLS